MTNARDRGSRARRIEGLALVLGLLIGCGDRPEAISRSTPLVDELHAPDILYEARSLRPPPEPGSNRFVTGWVGFERQGVLWLRARPGAALVEVVNLGIGPRELLLEGDVTAGVRSGRIAVAGEAPQEVALGAEVRIELPADLPIGRVPITIEVGKGAWDVRSARIAPATRPGSAACADGACTQSGNSLIDFVRWVPEGTLLEGEFVPVLDAGADAAFELRVEPEGQPSRTAFAWRTADSPHKPQAAAIRVDLGSAGWVRVRLLARGRGVTGTWRALTLRLPEPAREAQQPAAPPSAPRLVIVYVMDALRADHLGHLGGPSTLSPTVDELAREGATFLNHFALAPNTLPSTKSLFTGIPFITGGHWMLPEEGPPTLAEAFQTAGYRTGLFSGNIHVTSRWRLDRGFDTADESVLFDFGDEGSYNRNAEQVHRAALDWLRALAPGERAFAYLHTMHPHNPYNPPPPWNSRFTEGIDSVIDSSTPTLRAIRRGDLQPTPADQERLRGLYRGAIAYNDARLALLLETLDEMYEPGEVLLLLTSDHGEELFDHGSVLHGHSLYDELLHVPLVVHWPGVVAPRRVEMSTDTLDVHAALAALARADGDPTALWRVLLGGSEASRPQARFAAASSLEGGIFAARSARRKLIRAPRTGVRWGMAGRRQPEFVFDLEADPGETLNLAGATDLETAWLRSRLDAWIARGRTLEGRGLTAKLDKETLDRLRALAYLP